MSDNVRRFRSIFNALKTLYPFDPTGNLVRHLTTLSYLINGIVGSKSSNLPNIADKNVDTTKKESRVKRYTRWVQNERIEYELYFLPFLQILLDSLAGQTLALAIDCSVVGRGCMCLMVSLIYKKRALPLCWLVVSQKKGHLSEEMHIELLEQLQKIIPEGTNVVFLGDGEFDGTQFLDTIDRYGWQYVCRTAKNSILTENDEEFVFENMDVGKDDFFSLPEVYFTKEQYGPIHAILWWEKTYKKPIYLITNIELAMEACYWYKKRFCIETFFSDQKSRGFNLHKSHISDPERIEKLLIPACLAYIWIVYLGTLAIKEQWYKIIHRTNRCDLSLFRLGLVLLDHFINQQMDIHVHFKMLKFQNPF